MSSKQCIKMRVNATAIVDMILLLRKGAYSQKEIIAEIGVNRDTVRKWLRLLHARRMVFIESYRPRRGNYTALWKFGWYEQDAPPPKIRTNSERSRDLRRKKMREAERVTPLTTVTTYLENRNV